MDFKFEDYLSEDERKAIVADVFRKGCIDKFKTDHERIFSNAAYGIVTKAMDIMFDTKWRQDLANNAQKVIANLSVTTVFARKNAWDREESEGYKVLEQTMHESRGLIKERVSEVIADLNHDDLRNYIASAVHDLCDEKLFTKGETK